MGQGCVGQKPRREKAMRLFKIAEVVCEEQPWDGRDDGLERTRSGAYLF